MNGAPVAGTLHLVPRWTMLAGPLERVLLSKRRVHGFQRLKTRNDCRQPHFHHVPMRLIRLLLPAGGNIEAASPGAPGRCGWRRCLRQPLQVRLCRIVNAAGDHSVGTSVHVGLHADDHHRRAVMHPLGAPSSRCGRNELQRDPVLAQRHAIDDAGQACAETEAQLARRRVAHHINRLR